MFFSHQNLQNEKQKLLTKRSKLAPVEIAVYKNEELEKALRAGNLEKYKVIKILTISQIINLSLNILLSKEIKRRNRRKNSKN